MGIDKKGFYTLRDVLKSGAQYVIPLSDRSRGKSYEVKRHCLLKAYQSGKATLGLIRRYDEDITDTNIQPYFDDNNRPDKPDAPGAVEVITDGEYNYIHVFRHRIYFAHRSVTEDGVEHIVRGQQIGTVFALNLDERYKSQQYPELEDIIFEEFVTRKLYLRDEPTRLQHLVSTIIRRRNGNVFMIANTISRVCPYFQEWSLKGIPSMKPGTIQTYKVDDTLIAVELVEASSEKKKSKMFFGQAGKAIQGGHWESESVPHLPKAYEEFDVLYSVALRYSEFTFKLDLLIDDNADMTLYVYPYTKPTIPDDMILITDEYALSSTVRSTFKRAIRSECKIVELYRQQKICYASNLCGADFKSCLQNMRAGFTLA